MFGAHPSGRPLTNKERELARSVFNDAINYDVIRIHNRKWWWFQPKRTVMAPDGHMWFHPKSDLFCDDYCDVNLSRQGLFIHELTHVWQYQKGIFLPLRRMPLARYHYSLKPGWTLQKYGLEQQAEIVKHVFLLRKGVKIAGASLDQYDGILPF